MIIRSYILDAVEKIIGDPSKKRKVLITIGWWYFYPTNSVSLS